MNVDLADLVPKFNLKPSVAGVDDAIEVEPGHAGYPILRQEVTYGVKRVPKLIWRGWSFDNK
ncbi:hypothetical protein [Sphingomonas kyeonggiensis]|uniref:Uncharacterized protein n=1 Tax=Sphingomonas kyeonggiensis TaxID=1268553 RepID=A0A7W6JS71_9SPHN|nr:hypothetical protein [Sphingomonas kyeonggiensis]MBB4097487.1 hypothetical protein [Sphingomonas kyeonggiensis]